MTEDQDSTSPTTPTATVPSTGAEQDSISTGTPSTPVDTSEGTIIVGDSTGTEDPTDSSTDQIIPPTTTNPSTGTVVDDSAGIDGPQAPTDPSVIPPTSGTTDESFFDGSTIVPDNQQDVPQEKDEEHISTDQFVYLDDEDGNSSDQSDSGEVDNVVIIMPTPGHDDTTSDETSAGIPDFEYGSNINDYSLNQPSQEDEEETEDELKNDSVAFGDTVEELSEESDDDKKDKGKDKPADDEDELNIDPNAEDEESITPADTQVSDVDPNSEEDESQSINILPNDESEPSTVGDNEGSNSQPDDKKGQDEGKPADDEDELNIDPNAEDEESITPADTQVSDVDPNSEEDESQSINILPNDESEPSTVGDDEGSGGDKDISPNTPEEATDGTVISIPPLDQDESVPLDTESEIPFPPTGEDLPENEALSPVGLESGGKCDVSKDVMCAICPSIFPFFISPYKV